MNYIALAAAVAATSVVSRAYAQDGVPAFIPGEVSVFEERDANGNIARATQIETSIEE